VLGLRHARKLSNRAWNGYNKRGQKYRAAGTLPAIRLRHHLILPLCIRRQAPTARTGLPLKNAAMDRDALIVIVETGEAGARLPRAKEKISYPEPSAE
jgi:hypothetical protein